MISKFDISKLQDLPIEQVAEALTLKVKNHKSLCPFHADSRPSLTFNRARNRYRCFVCNARGGAIDLVMHTQGWTFIDSCHWLAKAFDISISDDDRNVLTGSPNTIKQKKFTNNSRVICGNLRLEEKTSTSRSEEKISSSRLEETPDIPYLTRLMAQPVLNSEAQRFLFEDRKLSRKAIEQLGISSISYSCPMSSSPHPSYFDGPALLIPYRDIDGNLLSVQSRYLGKQSSPSWGERGGHPRFRFPRGSRCSIFNLPVLKTCKPNEPVFITEGVTDCLAILSAGFKAIAIPSATLLNPEDVDLISSSFISHNSSVHMYPDADDPGERLFLQLKALLEESSSRIAYPVSIIRHSLPAGFKDVGQYYAFIHRNDK